MVVGLELLSFGKLWILIYFYLIFDGLHHRKNCISTNSSNSEVLYASKDILTIKILSNVHARRLTVSQRPLPHSAKFILGCRFFVHGCVSIILVSLSGDVESNPGPTDNINSRKSNESLTFVYQNVRSLKSTYLDNSNNCKENKLSCFHDIVMTNHFDVIALTETWLDNSISNHEILQNGYKITRRDRQNGKRGGGVLLAVKDSITIEPFNFTSKTLELASVVINSFSKKVLVSVCYRPPNAGIEFLHDLNSFLKFAFDSKFKDIILLGDFNYPSIQWLNGSGFSDLSTENGFIDVLQEAGLFQLVNSQTRGQNTIDLLLTTNEYLIDNINVTDDDSVSLKSDHKAITLDVNLNRKPKLLTKRLVYNYKKGDFDSLRAILRSLPLTDIVLSENDIAIAWAKWKDVFLAAVDTYIPKSTIKRSYKPPYITSDIIHAIHKKETLRKRAKSSNSPQLWEKFRELRRNIKSAIKTKKREYISSLAESVQNNSKEFWRFFKAKSTKSSLPDTMTLNGLKLTTAETKANAFNKYFASVFHPGSNPLYSPPVSGPDKLESITVSVEEVNKLLSGLSTSKATGPDGISARLLKECSEVLAPSLTALFNMSLSLGTVPPEWKEANIVPVPKKGDIHEICNYRPISLLSLVSKVLEHAVHIHVSDFVKSSLHDLQHGFRQRRSCTTQLVGVFHDVGKALDCGKETDMIYLDFSKAFDSVPHQKLLFKLQHHGISGSLLSWFSDYLKGRRQRVVVEGASSSFLDVTSGVPQGSIIGPLLFLIYVNDLPNSAKHSMVPMFADDSKCYRAIQNPEDRNLLQSDLTSLNNWSSMWDLKFNAKKCIAVRFSRKRDILPPAMYHLSQEPIMFTSSQNDLGILVSNDLKWSPHIANIVAKANRMIGFLRRNCTHFTDVHARRLLYLSLVRAHLSYGSEIWAPQGSCADLLRLESVQRRATKFILQDYKSSYSERLKKLNLIPISYWFEIKDIVFFYKCKSGIFELNVEHYTNHSIHRSTRSSSVGSLRPNLCKTSLFRNSYFNRIVFLWNSLSSEIKSSSSVTTLKTKLYLHYINKLNSTFDVDRPRTWNTLCTKCRSLQTNCCS